ncbi:hypothetical protein [Bacillus wiedmannii]|uniref:hypothetical protein n=1 Tax=Bacillus wiedmannii TaxID=1890302 RepID=UPI000BF204F8|nr:hypothetical protein [Bacillus wiedmannii]PEM08544.1 hypothetical protein CN610_20035 [Bacillus wiedmannii]
MVMDLILLLVLTFAAGAFTMTILLVIKGALEGRFKFNKESFWVFIVLIVLPWAVVMYELFTYKL